MYKIVNGSELNLDYGQLSNKKLIQNYGYSIKNNPNDYLKLYISKYNKNNMIYFS